MQKVLDSYSIELVEKASKIKALIFDVDGVLTNGGITYDSSGNEYKTFNVKDGQIIKPLKEAGVLVGLITGRDSEIVKRRATELKLDFHYQAVANKLELYNDIIVMHHLENYQVAYIGDDLIDLGIMQNCGLSAAPSDAPIYVQDHVNMVCKARGGEGVLREVADLILASQNKLENVVASYLK